MAMFPQPARNTDPYPRVVNYHRAELLRTRVLTPRPGPRTALATVRARVGQATGTYPQYEQPSMLWQLIGVAAVGVGWYHGYLRNGGSLGWGFGWGIMGFLFPIPTLAVALAQASMGSGGFKLGKRASA